MPTKEDLETLMQGSIEGHHAFANIATNLDLKGTAMRFSALLNVKKEPYPMKVIQLYALRLSIKNPKNRLPRGAKPFKITVEDPPEFKIQRAKAISILDHRDRS